MYKKLRTTSAWLGIFILFTLLLSTNVIAQIEDITPATLGSFIFTPTTIDISTEDQTVTTILQITDDLSGFSSGSVYFSSPSGSQIVFGNISQISGDTYQALITIPRFSEIGIWQVSPFVLLDDFANNKDSLSTSELAAMGFPTELEVTGTQDITPATLGSFIFTPTTIDISTEDQTVTTILQITDDLSGFSSGSVYFSSPSGSQIVFGNISQISGDIYQALITIPRFSEIGIWQVSPFVLLDDFANNKDSLSTSELATMGFPTELEVTGTQDITPATLGSFIFTPTTIDISTEDQTVTTILQITDDLSGFSSGSVYFSSPSGSQIVFGNISQISGDTYQALITIPRFSEIGIWQVSPFVLLDDFANNKDSLSTSELAAMGFPTELEVVSIVEDTTPPELAETDGFDFTPKTINVSSGSQTVTVRLRVTDDLSGVRSVRATFARPSGPPNIGASTIRIEGNAINGVYEGTATFPQFIETGIWRADFITLSDAADNEIVLRESDLIDMGFPTQLEVVSTVEDTTPPELAETDGFDFTPKTINVSSGSQTVTVRLRVTDDLSGVRSVRATFARPSGPPNIGASTIRIEGNAINGVYEGTATFPQFIETGIWRADFITLSDAADNEIVLRESDLIDMGFPTQLEVVSTVEDTTPPELAETDGFDFTPKTINVSSGSQTVTVRLRVTDDLSGVRSVRATFARPSGPPNIGASTIRIEGNAINGVYEGTATFPQFIETGIWRADFITLSDAADNEIVLRESDLIDMGFPTELEVVSDTDGDGIPDDQDACPSSDLSETVVIDDCDSDVDNVLFEDGCTISDLISQCADDADNHDEFVSSVSHTTNSLKKEGIISGNEKGKIQKCAAKAHIP